MNRNTFKARTSRSRMLACAAIAIAAAGCDSIPTEPLVAAALIEVSGNDQELVTGASQSEPLVVRVVDQHGAGFGGAPVEWEIVQGEGTLNASAPLSDADGYAKVVYSAGNATGDVSVSATVVGLQPIVFRVVVTPAGEAP